MRSADLGIVLDSAVYNPQSEIGRPLEPDAVNTVEGRNSYSMTVPFPFDRDGAVLAFWAFGLCTLVFDSVIQDDADV